MLSLAVTSSTSVVGVAVGPAGAGPLAFEQVTTDRRHAEELTPLLAAVLQRAGVGLNQIEQFVVDVGPGRFTGLRVGLATVRALALAADRPVVALTSLEILAGAQLAGAGAQLAGAQAAGDSAGARGGTGAGVVAGPGGPVLAVVDARRSEVFQQRFEADGTWSEPMVGAPDELAPDHHQAEADGLIIVGDGADRYPDHYGPRVVTGQAPSAATMVMLAADRPAGPGSAASPVYLRQPDVNVTFKTRDGVVGRLPSSPSTPPPA